MLSSAGMAAAVTSSESVPTRVADFLTCSSRSVLQQSCHSCAAQTERARGSLGPGREDGVAPAAISRSLTLTIVRVGSSPGGK